MAREYAAFISYRHKPLDMAVATKLHKAIERFKIPRDLRREAQKNPGKVFTSWEGMPPERMLVFRDREELPLSNDLTSDIFDALDNARCLIVVCTPDTPKSLWVRREISHFIEKHGRKRIITVLAAGTPEESIPREITARLADDGVTVLEEFEPLVAYLTADNQREVMKKLDKELLRVCAALLGCPYDSLKQRHKRRKMQQALAAAAAAFLVALSFIGILVNRNLEIQAQKLEVEAQKQQVELQKQEAENQRRMVQLRESELLAADARAALDSGNTREAIENAVAALPKAGEEDRPYYAPAEAVLMEAMDVMGGTEEHVMLSDVVLEQMTPVNHMDISTDGTIIVTIDKYGVLHGYDAVTGKEKWSDIMTTTEDSTYTSYVRISEDDSCLISVYGETMEGRALQDGQLLWCYDMDLAAEGYFIYDDDKNRIAILESYYSGEEDASLIELVILSAETGEEEQRIPLEKREDMLYQTIHDSDQPRLSDGGVFSADGRYFACAFYRNHDNEEKSHLICFVADLQEGKLVRKYERDIDDRSFDLSAMRFYEDGLVMALEPYDGTVASMLLKLDWEKGRWLWEMNTPTELDEGLVTSGRTGYVMLLQDIALVGKSDKIYAIDMKTGKILHTATFPGRLSAMYPAGDSYFAFALKDGTYAIGWYSVKNGFTLTTESFFEIWASVGEHKLLQIFGGGIVQYYTDGNYVELSVSNVDRPGYAVVVPEGSPNQIVIKRPVVLEKTVQTTPLTVPVDMEDVRCYDSACVRSKDNQLILGQFSYSDENYHKHYLYFGIDSMTHEVKQKLEMNDGYSLDQIHILADGSGFIIKNSDGVVTLTRDGKQTVLTERVDPNRSEQEQYVVRGMVQTDSTYLTDGTVLTAHSDSKNITIWKDGMEVGTVPLPEDHQHLGEWEANLQRYLRAGRNGYLMTHFTWLMEPISTTDVAFYNTANGTWFRPELTVPLTNSDSYAFAEKKPLFAAVDGEHQVRVWDLQAGREIAAFPLQLPYNCVIHMDFLLDDGYLMVKTKDAKVLVYEIATGQILLQDQLETTSSGYLTAQTDPSSQRLYIIDSSLAGTNTLCIDMRSWTVLARASKILCYVPQTDELYYADNTYGNPESRIFYFQVPTTEELVELGQQFLENDSVS